MLHYAIIYVICYMKTPSPSPVTSVGARCTPGLYLTPNVVDA